MDGIATPGDVVAAGSGAMRLMMMAGWVIRGGRCDAHPRGSPGYE